MKYSNCRIALILRRGEAHNRYGDNRKCSFDIFENYIQGITPNTRSDKLNKRIRVNR